MVYSGGVRSFVQLAVLLALALSTLPSIQAKGPKTHAPKQNQICSVSDGDKSWGVQAINDDSCANGGLGCYGNHCRFCKVLNTPKSKHLNACLLYGVAFTSTVPVAVTEGPCEVSSGDVAAGISAVTDSGCVNGGLGCFKDRCRFCKVVETPQSSGFIACSSLDKSYSTPVATTVAPVTAAPDVPIAPATAAPTVAAPDVPTPQIPTTTATDVPATPAPVVVDIVTEVPIAGTDAPVSTPTTVSTDAPIIATSAPVIDQTCSIVPSVGDTDAGVNIVTDHTCTSGGLGCLSDVCRFCKLKTTTQSNPYMDCALVGATSVTEPTVTPVATTETPTVTAVVGTEAPDTTTPVIPDATTEAPVVPDATTEAPAVTEVPISTTEAPVVSTDVPSATTETPTTTEVPTSTTEAPIVSVDTPAPPNTCTLVASTEDVDLGISVGTDASCSSGGVGCIDKICRFCKVTTSLQSAPYVDCISLEGGSQSEAPVVDTVDTTDSPGVPSETPAATTDATTETPIISTDTPVATTEAPTTSIDAPNATTEAPTTSIDAPNATTEAPSVTVTADTTTEAPTDTPVATTNALTSHDTCGIVAAAGDVAVGVHITTDVCCSAGGIGCINDLCRFCKVQNTTQSAAFVDCNSLSSFTSNSAASTTTSPVTSIPVTPASCDLVASTGDVSVGIHVITDSRCNAGGIGCINDVCRFCKVITSVQSAAFIDCATVNGYTPETEAPTASTTPNVSSTLPASEATCTQIASDGDHAVGVDITTDASCSSGGVGCIDKVCRFCQVTATVQSTAFVGCSLFPNYTPRSETPIDTTTSSLPTPSTPVTEPSCGLVVSAGDAAVGISITSDTTCSAGGVGCIDSVCRFCKVTTTVQSAAFVDCTATAGFTLASNAPVDTTAPSVVSTTSTPIISTPAVTCSLVVSEGDAAVGIDIIADSTCQFGGVGCIDNVCRFCKVKPTEQSAAFVDCLSVTRPLAPLDSTLEPASTNVDTSVPTTTTAEVPTEISSDGSVTSITETPDTSSGASEVPASDFTTGSSATTTDSDVPSSTTAVTDDSTHATDTPIADNAGSGSEVPPADATKPTDLTTDVPSATSNTNTSTTTSPDGIAPGVDITGLTGFPKAGANDTVTEAPAVNVDTSDMLTEAPVVTTQPPTKLPVPGIDDDDDWEGSDSASDADSDSTYYDSMDSLEGL